MACFRSTPRAVAPPVGIAITIPNRVCGPASMDQLMKPSVSPPSSWQDEGLEFELIDLEEARRILDSESVSQFDVARVMRVCGRFPFQKQPISCRFLQVCASLIPKFSRPESRATTTVRESWQRLGAPSRGSRRRRPLQLESCLSVVSNGREISTLRCTAALNDCFDCESQLVRVSTRSGPSPNDSPLELSRYCPSAYSELLNFLNLCHDLVAGRRRGETVG